jgi:hypothetical protein
MEIEFVSPEQDVDPENDNVDVRVRLDDGRVFTLLVATPNNLYWCMDNESTDYYFGVPLLIVRALTRSNIERAILALLEDERSLEIYGTQQNTE